MTLSPRQKFIVAATCLGVLVLVGVLQGAAFSASTLARFVLALASLVGLAVFWVKSRAGAASAFKSASRLVVIQRTGLSARSGVALIEVDGRPFIIVHGDGFARLRAAPRRVRVQSTSRPECDRSSGVIHQ